MPRKARPLNLEELLEALNRVSVSDIDAAIRRLQDQIAPLQCQIVRLSALRGRWTQPVADSPAEAADVSAVSNPLSDDADESSAEMESIETESTAEQVTSTTPKVSPRRDDELAAKIQTYLSFSGPSQVAVIAHQIDRDYYDVYACVTHRTDYFASEGSGTNRRISNKSHH